jgi:hypothetical protein
MTPPFPLSSPPLQDAKHRVGFSMRWVHTDRRQANLLPSSQSIGSNEGTTLEIRTIYRNRNGRKHALTAQDRLNSQKTTFEHLNLRQKCNGDIEYSGIFENSLDNSAHLGTLTVS